MIVPMLSCYSCSHFESQEFAPGTQVGDIFGKCRIRAPVVSGGIGVWPRVTGGDYCAEFDPDFWDRKSQGGEVVPMAGTLEYRGHVGQFEWDDAVKSFTGHVVDIPGEIYFEGATYSEMVENFASLTDAHLSVDASEEG